MEKSIEEKADELSKAVIEHFESKLREDVMVRPSINHIVGIAFEVRKSLKQAQSEMYSREELRLVYDYGEANIDSDGCHIDNPDEDFKEVIKTILKDRKQNLK